MASKSLELVLPRIMEDLEGKKNIAGFKDLIELKVPIRKGIEEYNKKNWIDSAENFVKTWRRSENQISRHFQKELSLDDLSLSIEEELQWGKDITRTIGWLGICALHDTAVSYFQTPEDTNKKLDKTKFGVDYKEEMTFGLVIGKKVILDRKNEMNAGEPVANILPVLDAIGRMLHHNSTFKDIARCIAWFCLKHLDMIDISKENLLSPKLQSSTSEEMFRNLSLIIIRTIRHESWIKGKAMAILTTISHGIEDETAWNDLYKETLRVGKINPLRIMLLEQTQNSTAPQFSRETRKWGDY